ncbi:MAG: ribonuclease T2 [Pseudomonadota bacterium]
MRMFLAAIAMLWAASVAADRAGQFDYYVLALSWTPTWCALEGDTRGAEQCDASRNFGWTLHGLWPQHEIGWPSNCTTSKRDPSRRATSAMADIMGSGGLAWHQWKKHGRCANLTSEDYFALSRLAYEAVVRPDVLRQLDRPVRLPADVIEDAFLEVNPELEPDGLTVTCRDGRVQEVRICLTRDLEPRTCGSDVIRDCSLRDALFEPIR